MAHPDELQPLLNPTLENAAEAVGDTPQQASPAAIRKALTSALLWFGAAIALCVVAYLVVSVPVSWFPSATPKAWLAGDLAITRGEGVRIADDLQVTTVEPTTDSAVVSAITDFRATEYPVIAWVAIDLADNADVRLLWLSDYATSKINAVQLTVVSGRLLPVSLAKNPAWIGNIKGLALLIRGPLEQPVRVHSVVAKPTGAVELLRDRAREWIAFEGWSGTSINTVAGGADVQDLPLPTLLAVAIVLAIAAWYGYARRHASVSALPIAIAMLFVLSWGVLDARWLFNLGRQVVRTGSLYGGKDWYEQSVAAEDGQLFAFIERARAKMPATPARVFMVADAHYFRGRGAYHLYPHNVYFDPWANTMPLPSQLHPGDYLVVYYRRGVQFDPTLHRLRWDANPPIAAEALLIEPGAGLFRIL